MHHVLLFLKSILLGSLLLLFSMVQASQLSITPIGETHYHKINGSHDQLTYQFKLTNILQYTDLYLGSIKLTNVSSGFTVTIKQPCANLGDTPLKPGESCTLTYEAPTPELANKTETQTFNAQFLVALDTGITVTSPSFGVTVSPTPGQFSFSQDGKMISALNTIKGDTGTVELSNIGGTTVTGLTFIIPDDLNAIISGNCLSKASLAGGASCELAYDASHITGTIQGTIKVSSASALTAELPVKIDTAGRLDIQQNGDNVSRLQLARGQTGTLIVSNPESVALTGLQFTVPDDLTAIVTGSCIGATSLAAGAQCELSYDTTHATTPVTGAISITGNFGVDVRLPVLLSVQGLLSVQHNTQAINALDITTSKMGTVKVENTGEVPLTDLHVTISSNLHSIITNDCSSITNLAVGASCQLNYNSSSVTELTQGIIAISAAPGVNVQLPVTVSLLGHFVVREQGLDLNTLSITSSAAGMIHVENTGGTTIKNFNVTTPDITGVTWTNHCSPYSTLPPAGVCTIDYSAGANPDVSGTHTLTISGDDADNSPAAVTVNVTDSWHQSGPYGGEIYALAVDPNNANTVYAGSAGGGIFKSTDSGANWHLVGLRGEGVYAFLFSSDGATLYAGTSSGVYKSTDDGTSWVPFNDGLTGYISARVFTASADDTTLYAGNYRTVYESVGGAAWQPVGAGFNSNIEALTIIDNNLYVGTKSNGVFKFNSTNNTWEPVNTGLQSNALYINALVVYDGSLYVATDSGVFKLNSTNETWEPVGVELNNTSIYDLVVDNGSLYAIGRRGYKFFSTSNEWQSIGGELNGNASAHSLVFSNNGATMYAGSSSGQGIQKASYSDGAWSAWALANEGVTAVFVPHLVFSGGKLYAMVGGSNGFGFIQQSSDGGATWEASTLSEKILSLFASSGTVYAGGSGAVYKTADNGVSWQQVGNNLPYEKVDAIVTFNDVVYAGLDSGTVYQFKNNTWASTGTGLPGDWIGALAVSNNGSTVYAGTYGAGVYQLASGTTNWISVGTGLESSDVKALVVSSDGTLYAATYGEGVLRFNTTNDTWEPMNNGLDGLYINSLIFSGNHLYAGNNDGVYQYLPSLDKWVPVGGDALLSLYVYTLATATDGTGASYLIAGTQSTSTFRNLLSPAPSERKH